MIRIKLIKSVGIILIIGALVPLCLAGVLYGRTKAFLKKAVTTEAEIIEMVYQSSKSGGSYAPKYRFTAKDGTEHTVHSSISSRPPAFQTGDKVRVFYNPSAPKKTKIDTFWQLWLVPFVFGAMGCGMITFGFLLVLLLPVVIRMRDQ